MSHCPGNIEDFKIKRGSHGGGVNHQLPEEVPVPVPPVHAPTSMPPNLSSPACNTRKKKSKNYKDTGDYDWVGLLGCCQVLILQIFTYMVEYKVTRSVVTNYHEWYFLESRDGTLFISPCIPSTAMNPSVFQSLAFFAHHIGHG